MAVTNAEAINQNPAPCLRDECRSPTPSQGARRAGRDADNDM
ncbi:hypothetical protein [Kitasatospora azatica]|nr:hypothetical protein [Kitasatospora azatica]